MTIELNSVRVKIKNGTLTVWEGSILEDKLFKMPITLIPQVKWSKDLELVIIGALIEAKEYEAVLAMKKNEEKK